MDPLSKDISIINNVITENSFKLNVSRNHLDMIHSKMKNHEEFEPEGTQEINNN